MNRHFTIIFCGVMLALNAISCDMLLTGFFAIQADLGTTIERVQAVIPIYLMSTAVGQLLFGPASDKYGRKPVLIGGLLIYLAGSFLAIFAATIGILWLARFLQGFGGACAIVIARAILRDTHSGTDLARAMAQAMAIFAIGPLLAPLAGAGLMALGSWRTVFIGLCVVGGALVVAAALLYRETNPAPDPRALDLANLRTAARRVLTHPQSRRYLMACLLLQTIVVSFLVNMPRLYKSAFDVDGTTLAQLFALTAIGIVIGQLISNKVIARIGVIPTFRIATLIFSGTIALMWLLARFDAPSLVMFTLLFFVFNLSFLVVFTNGASLVLDPHRDIAGVASGLLGSITQLLGSALAMALVPVIAGRLSTWSSVQLLLVAALLAITFVPITVPQTRAPEAPR